MLFLTGTVAHASDLHHSTNVTGSIGLNVVPTARMDDVGTARLGLTHLDPYNHAFLGMQMTDNFHVHFRQSMRVSSAGQKSERVYPGADIKLRIAKEGRYKPEIAFGMESAFGHKRHSSEYFALSKRIYDFDLTAGVAWGRLGSAGQIRNPFTRIGGHFRHNRDYNNEDAAGPKDWFTGKNIGFFGGVEYFTPIEGFSFKADVGSDRYPGEFNSSDFKKPASWSVGVNYAPRNWVDIGASLIGGDKWMARITFQNDLFDWPGKSFKKSEPRSYVAGEGTSNRDKTKNEARADNIALGKIRVDDSDISGVLHLNGSQPSATQIGRAARHLAANAGKDIQTVTIIPVRNNLRGRAIVFSRRDLDSAIARRAGSPEEIWQDVSFAIDTRSVSENPSKRAYYIFPEIAFSFAEEDTSHLHRVSIVAEESKQYPWGFYGSNSIRLNLDDRLYQIDKNRRLPANPIRSDISHFARNTVALERSFVSWMASPLPDTHVAITAGYLEEMYAGVGAEILYRPFKSPFSVGAEIWRANKRKADSFMAMGLNGQHAYTGHLNLYYQPSFTDVTFFTKAGKYLGGDWGGTGGIETTFGPVKVKGFVTATNARDKDAFGKNTSYYGGLQLSLPFGNVPFVPEGSAARMKFEPMGRDAGQALDKPVSLFDFTEPMSYRHLGQSWQGILD